MFKTMLKPIEENFEEVKHLRGSLAHKLSLSSLGERDYTDLFNAVQVLYTYAVGCTHNDEPATGRVPRAGAVSVSPGEGGQGESGRPSKGKKGDEKGKEGAGKGKGGAGKGKIGKGKTNSRR